MAGPEGGYGPVNYSRPSGNPFAPIDNRILYNDMVRYQAISQYQQNVIQPATMTLSQQRKIASQTNFQYGVQGGQDPRFYQRQSRLNRMAYGSAVAKGMGDLNMWEETAAATSVAGVAGIAGFALPLVATMGAMHFVNKGVNNNLERQRYMHGIAADVEQYRGKLGFNQPLSYDRATQLGSDLYSSMSSPGQFFSKEQQMRIHKIGLSNDLLTAKSRGINSGTSQQYKQNVKELTETTEEVVKLLQTTLEGGMSVIKELQQKGFGSMKQIKQQVLQAKAIGGLTGMGAQNTMALGAAGAQAVQGTPWSANVGANMYQAGAAQASILAGSSQAGAYAVQRMGGVAQAGATLGRATMNMLSSGIGTRVAAYAMKADGSIDEGRLDRLTGGGVSAYEMVTRSNQVGYAMGGSRVRFDMFKEDMLNKLGQDPAKLGGMMRAGFSAWEQQRPYDKLEDKAWVFSGMYTNNSREKRLMYESLLGNPNYGRIKASMAVQSASLNRASLLREKGTLEKQIAGAGAAFTGFFNRVGEEIGYGSTAAIEGASQLVERAEVGLGRGFESVLKGVGLMGEYGGKNRAEYGDYEKRLGSLYGLGATSTAVGSAALSRLTAGDIQKFTRQPKKHAGMDAFVRKSTRAELQYITESAISGGNFLDDPKFRQAIDNDPSILALAKSQPDAFLPTLMGAKSKFAKTARAEFEDAVGVYDKWFGNLSKEEQNASRRRVQVGIAAIKADKFMDIREASYREKRTYRDSTPLEDRPRDIELNVLAAKNRARKAKDQGVMLPDGTFTFASAEEAAKSTAAAIQRAISPQTTGSYTMYGLSGTNTYKYSKDTEEAKEAKRFAREMDVNTKEVGWQRTFVEKARGLLRESQEDGPTATGRRAEWMANTKLMSYITGKKITTAIDAIDKEQGIKEYATRRGYMRAYAMSLPEDQRDPEFARILSTTAILPQSAGGMSEKEFSSFATGNAEKFMSFGFYKSELNNLTKATFLKKALNSEEAAKTSPTALMAQIQISEDMKAIYQGMKHGSKGVVSIGVDKEEQVDLSKEGAGDLALQRLRDERENLQAQYNYRDRDETSQGRGIASTVRPPVLNYWNNAWM